MISALTCLATVIYFEARDQELVGQVAVAQVVMERVLDYRYPETVCGVVTAGGETRNRCAFSFYCDGKSDDPKNEKAYWISTGIAVAILNGFTLDITGYATHYHAYYVQPKWAMAMKPTAVIGDHIFYKEQ
jgi:spore germination cell wall hydrolase CwlJ-like protein|tara:strand:+ start:881 stop:1273 length:393 start_codon:yes stop_codon:yes gene_type:complete